MLKKITTAAALALLTSSAFALPHLYVGAGVGTGSLHQKVNVNNQTTEFSADYKIAWTAHIGAMFTDNWGVEIGQNYFQHDNSQDALLNVQSNNNKSTYLALRGAIDLSPLITLYGKIGPAYVQNELDSVTALVVSDKIRKNNAITAYGGLGIEFNVSPTVNIFIEGSGNTPSGNVPGTTMVVGGVNFVIG